LNNDLLIIHTKLMTLSWSVRWWDGWSVGEMLL